MLSKRALFAASQFAFRKKISKSFHKSIVFNRFVSSYRPAFLASTAAVGVSAYLFYKNTIICDEEIAMGHDIKGNKSDDSITEPIKENKSSESITEPIKENKSDESITEPSKENKSDESITAPIKENKSDKSIIDALKVNANLEAKVDDSSGVTPTGKYEEAIKKSRNILYQMQTQYGAPGVIVGVSVDGKTVWTEGMGYADIENGVPCSEYTVMRIASISKSITAVAALKLMEQGLLDLDKSIHDYVPSFPQKTFDGKPVVITTRQLLSHTSGIRHYILKNNGNINSGESNVNTNGNSKDSKLSTKSGEQTPEKSGIESQEKNCPQKNKSSKINYVSNKQGEKSELDLWEYYIKDRNDLQSSLNMFKDDPLVSEPGTKYHYSTHAFTLVTAIMESVAKEDFKKHMKKMFKTLGMDCTYFDENDAIIYCRCRNYRRNKTGSLLHTPYVDNSYKWAGGGFLSTAVDLLRFANVMLYSYQLNNVNLGGNPSDECSQVQSKTLRPGFLSPETAKLMWTPVISDDKTTYYGLGWAIVPECQKYGCCKERVFRVLHTGAAVGASSVLLIVPNPLPEDASSSKSDIPPKGVAVFIAVNISNVSLTDFACVIADLFNSRFH